jgi:glutamate synthase domain-containing protein 2
MLQMTLDWATQRLINLLNAWREQIVDILVRLGLPSVKALRGRSDLLYYLADEQAYP